MQDSAPEMIRTDLRPNLATEVTKQRTWFLDEDERMGTDKKSKWERPAEATGYVRGQYSELPCSVLLVFGIDLKLPEASCLRTLALQLQWLISSS